MTALDTASPEDPTPAPDGEPISAATLITVYTWLRARRLTITDGEQEMRLPDLLDLWREWGPHRLPAGSFDYEPCAPPTT